MRRPVDGRTQAGGALPDAVVPERGTEALLLSAFAALPDLAVVVFDRDMRIEAVHGAAAARHGYFPERMVGRRAPDILPAAVWERLGPLYVRALTGETVSVEVTTHDGTARYATTFTPVRHGGLLIGGMACLREIPLHDQATETREPPAAREPADRLFEASFAAAPIGMCLVDPTGRFLRVNPALCALLARSERELLAGDFQDLTHPDDLEKDLVLLGETLAGVRDGYELEKRYLRPDGGVIEARLSVSLVRDAAGAPAHFVSQIVDLTALHEARRELAEAKGRLQAILDHSSTAIYMRDLDQRWVIANPETCSIVGAPAEELIGRRMAETVPAELHAHLAAHDEEVLRAGQTCSFEEVATDARTGETHHFWSRKFPVRDVAGQVVGLGGISVDVTERDRAQRELAAARALFESAFANAPLGMHISRGLPDGTMEIIRCNAAFCRMIGREAEEVIGHPEAQFVHPEDGALRAAIIADALAGRPAGGELRLRHRDDHDVWVATTPALARGADGERLLVVQCVDVSERRRLEAALRHRADHDALTGLLRRGRFEEELEREAARVARLGRPAALLLIDLDGFKGVNDRLGHAAGDALLKRIGDTLSEELRDCDVVARLGGDEFAAILPETDTASGILVADRLRRAVRAGGSTAHDGERVGVTASIGLTELDGEARSTVAGLLHEADVALYRAKGTGRDRTVAHGATLSG